MSAPALLLLVLAPLASAPASQEPPPNGKITVTCTFSNPGYAGACAVDEEVDAKTAPRAACEAVLSCLNNPLCVKTYCNATTVRGGWTLVKAERKASR